MGLKKDIYTKLDDGSCSRWELWDGALCENKRMYSGGWAYARAQKRGKKWRLVYRLGTSGLTLPDLFSKMFKTDIELVAAINEFAEWAFDSQVCIIAAQQRECE